MTRRLFFLLCLLPFAASAAPPPDRTVAVTFDDLPFAAVPTEDDGYLETMTTRLLHSLQAEHVPAVGFVNESKLARDGTPDAVRIGLLRTWLQAGFELGNHT